VRHASRIATGPRPGRSLRAFAQLPAPSVVADLIRGSLIDQSTRPDGDGFLVLPPSIVGPSGRRAHRSAGPIQAGATKER